MSSLANELEKLAGEATPGPWEATERSGYREILAPCADSDWYGRPKTHAVAYIDTEIDEKSTDAALIVALRNNLPTILSALREREAVTNWLRGHSIAGDHLASRIEAGEHMKGEG